MNEEMITRLADEHLLRQMKTAGKLPKEVMEIFKKSPAFKQMAKAEYVMSKTIQMMFRREFGTRNFAFFRLLVELRQFSLGGPIELGMYEKLFRMSKILLRTKGSDGTPLNSILRGKVLVSIKSWKRYLTRIENQIRNSQGNGVIYSKGNTYLLDADYVSQLLQSNIAWKKLILGLTNLIEEIGRDKGINITNSKKPSVSTGWFGRFRKSSVKEVKLRDLEDNDPETYEIVASQRKTLKEIDTEIGNAIAAEGLIKDKAMILGRAVIIGIDPDTEEITVFDRGMGATPVKKIIEVVNGKERTRWEGEYVDRLKERDEQREKLYHIPSASALLTPAKMEALRRLSDEQLAMRATGEIEFVAMTDDKAKKDKNTRMFPVQDVEIDGDIKQVIVDGRFKGFLLDDMINANGRLVEGTGYAFDPKKNRPVRRNIGDTEPYITTIEVKDEYGNTSTRLQINVPGIRDEENGRIRNRLHRLSSNTAGKAGSIATMKYEDQTRRRTYTCDVKDYALIQNLVGGAMVLSESAMKEVNNYYEDLSLAESATADENLAFYSQAALGGFKASSPKLLNVQKKALAWLDANGNKGVIALDTGVGKTVTSISMMQKMIRDGATEEGASYTNSKNEEILTNGRFLWVCPAKLEGNVPKEVEKWLAGQGEKEKMDSSVKNSKLAMIRRLANSEGESPAEYLIARLDCMSFGRWASANKRGIYHSTALKKKMPFKAEEFVAIFFDEAQNLTGSGKASYYAANVEHPHKICLSASPMEHSPMDSYMLSAICNNTPIVYHDEMKDSERAIVKKNREEMKRFSERYCEKIGPRIVGVKDDPLIKRELDVWTKRNLFYADKQEVETDPVLKPLDRRTTVVSMNEDLEKVYAATTEGIKKVLAGMTTMFRERGDFHYLYKEKKDEDGNVIYQTEMNEDGTPKMESVLMDGILGSTYMNEAGEEIEVSEQNLDEYLQMRGMTREEVTEEIPVVKTDKEGNPLPEFQTEVDEFGNETPIKKTYGGEAVMRFDKSLTESMRSKIEKMMKKTMAPLLKIINGLSNYPEEAMLDLADMMENKADAPNILKNGPRSKPPGIGLFRNLEAAGITPEMLRGLVNGKDEEGNPLIGNPKLEYCTDELRNIMDNDSPEIPSSRALLFTDDLRLVQLSAQHLSKQIAGYHLAATDKKMFIYRNGRLMEKPLKLRIPAEVIKACFAPRGFAPGQERTKEQVKKNKEKAKRRKQAWLKKNGGAWAMHKQPFTQRLYRPYPNLPTARDRRAWVNKYNKKLKSNKEWPEFIFNKIVQPEPKFKTITLHGQSYSTGQNLQAFNTVIHLDRDHWNSEEMKQRTARAWRQGQKETVSEITVDLTYNYNGPRTEAGESSKREKTLDEIRRYFQEMESEMFDAVIKGAQDTVLGEEFADLKQTSAGFRSSSKDVAALILGASPFLSKPPNEMED